MARLEITFNSAYREGDSISFTINSISYTFVFVDKDVFEAEDFEIPLGGGNGPVDPNVLNFVEQRLEQFVHRGISGFSVNATTYAFSSSFNDVFENVSTNTSRISISLIESQTPGALPYVEQSDIIVFRTSNNVEFNGSFIITINNVEYAFFFVERPNGETEPFEISLPFLRSRPDRGVSWFVSAAINNLNGNSDLVIDGINSNVTDSDRLVSPIFSENNFRVQEVVVQGDPSLGIIVYKGNSEDILTATISTEIPPNRGVIGVAPVVEIVGSVKYRIFAGYDGPSIGATVLRPVEQINSSGLFTADSTQITADSTTRTADENN